MLKAQANLALPNPLNFSPLRDLRRVSLPYAARISIGRGLRDHVRLYISLGYTLIFGVVSVWLYRAEIHTGFAISVIFGSLFALYSVIPWRLKLPLGLNLSPVPYFLYNAILALVLGFLVSVLAYMVPIMIFHGWEASEWLYAFGWRLCAFMSPILAVTGFSIALGEDYAHNQDRLEARARRFQRLAEQARVIALRAQINPHFFFNSLNTIAALIPVEPEKAEQAVELLAEALRPALLREQPLLGTLESELKIAGAYAELEHLRLGDRVAISFDVDETLNGTVVPSLCLQPLLENVFRHGATKHAGGYRVGLVARPEADFLVVEIQGHPEGASVEFDAPDFAPAVAREGHALHNIQTRVAMLFGSNTEVDVRVRSQDHASVARLRIPLDGPTPQARAMEARIREGHSPEEVVKP